MRASCLRPFVLLGHSPHTRPYLGTGLATSRAATGPQAAELIFKKDFCSFPQTCHARRPLRAPNMRAKLAVSLTRGRAFLLVVLRRRLGTWGAGGGSVLLHVQWRSRLAWSDGVSVWNGMVPYRYGRLLAWSRTSGVSLRFLALAQKSQPQVLFMGSSFHLPRL